MSLTPEKKETWQQYQVGDTRECESGVIMKNLLAMPVSKVKDQASDRSTSAEVKRARIEIPILCMHELHLISSTRHRQKRPKSVRAAPGPAMQPQRARRRAKRRL